MSVDEGLLVVARREDVHVGSVYGTENVVQASVFAVSAQFGEVLSQSQKSFFVFRPPDESSEDVAVDGVADLVHSSADGRLGHSMGVGHAVVERVRAEEPECKQQLLVAGQSVASSGRSVQGRPQLSSQPLRLSSAQPERFLKVSSVEV
jgi:hypothetical protein